MIYLFKNDKTLNTDYPIISEDAILSMPERRQINGLWTVSAELIVEGIYEHVNNSEFIGFYDIDDRFQLYKIIDLQVNNDLFIIDAVYLFHDEAYSGEVIRDRRFRGRQADAAAIAAFEPIGWELDGHDFTDERTTNFFYISPLEALARIEEVWGVEFNFWLVFDGQKILGKYYEVRKQIGVRSNRIYEYNENISSVTHTQSRQDIVTAVLPRGRGEELEEGVFGRSIQIDDVVWSTENGDPLNKPAGQDYLEIPEMTALWGYEGVKPRIRKVDFSQEEDPENLIQLAYEWLLENCVPKVIFKLSIDDGAGHKLGDIVGVSYKEINLTSYTRVFEVEHDHRTGTTIVEFGDVELKSDRRISAIRSDIDRIESNNSQVVELQQQFNDAFDRKVRDMEQEYDQALIDAQAEIQAAEQRMAALIGQAREDFDTEFIDEIERVEREAEQEYNNIRDKIESDISNTRSEMESEFEAEVERIEQEALAEYNRISGEITGSIDQARDEIEQDYSQAVQDARDYADSEILAKEQQYAEDWDIRDAQIQSTIEQIVGGSVDSLGSNLLEINSDLSEINSKLLSKLELDDISNLYADVDTITATLNTAREDLNTTIEDLNSTRDDLNTTRDDLQAKLDDAKAEFDSLEIGGRNLLREENFSSLNNYDNYMWEFHNLGTNQNMSLHYNNSTERYFEPGEYVISFEMKLGEDYGSSTANIRLSKNYESDPVFRSIQYVGSNFNSDWKRVTHQFSLSENANIGIQLYSRSHETVFIRNLQIEKGTVATDWTPAPEDVEQKITTLEQDIQYIDGELSAKLTQTDIEPFVNRISEAETNITVNATEISTLQDLTEVHGEDITTWSNLSQSTADEVSTLLTRVSDTEDGLTIAEASISATADEVSTLLTRVSDTEDGLAIAESDISANADAITARVTRTEFEGLEIGGRNLLVKINDGVSNNEYRDIRREDGIIYWTQKTGATSPYTLNSYAPSGEDTYTFSYKTDNVEDLRNYLYSTPSGRRSAELNIDDKGSYYQVSFTVNSFDPSNRFSFYGSNVLSPITEVMFWDIKLERGNKGTDWTPAPEDTDAKITLLSTDISITAEGLNALVTRTSDVEGAIESAITDISATADGLSALVTRTEATESGISQLETDLSVEAGKITAALSDISEIIGESENLFGEEAQLFDFGTEAQLYLTNDLSFTKGKYVIKLGNPEFYGLFDIYINNMNEFLIPIQPFDDEIEFELEEDSYYFGFVFLTTAQNVIDADVQIFRKTQSLSELTNDLSITAEGISALITLTSGIDETVSQLGTKLDIEAGLIEATLARVDDAETAIGTFQATADGFRAEVGVLQSDVDNIDDWIETKGSVIDQTADAITTKVWQSDIDDLKIGMRNLVRHTDFKEYEGQIDQWRPHTQFATIWNDTQENGFMLFRNSNINSTGTAMVGVRSPTLAIDIVEGRKYTLRFHGANGVGIPDPFNYVFVMDIDDIYGSNHQINRSREITPNYETLRGTEFTDLYEYTFTARWTGAADLLIGSFDTDRSEYANHWIAGIMLVEGDSVSKGWTPAPEDTNASITKLASDVSSVTQTASTIRAEVTTLTSNTDSLLDWRDERGSVFEQTADAITSRVWQADIDELDIPRANLILGTDFSNLAYGEVPDDWLMWQGDPYFIDGARYDGEMILIRTPNPNTLTRALAVRTSRLVEEVVEGRQYTLSVWANSYMPNNHFKLDYCYIENVDGRNQSLLNPIPMETKYLGNGNMTFTRYERTFTASFSGAARVIIGNTLDSATYRFIYIHEPVLVSGNKYKGYSVSTQEYLKYTDFVLRSDGFLLGGNYVGGEHYSAAIAGSSEGINILGDAIVTGSLTVKDLIETQAISAIEAVVGNVVADEIKSLTIDADDIEGITATFENMLVDSGNINTLVSQTAFIDAIETQTLNAIDANIGTVRTSFLEANVIKADHVEMNLSFTRRLFADNARVDILLTNTHFTDQIHTKSLDAIDANIGRVRSSFLESNVIQARHIQGGTILIEHIFSNNGRIDYLITKTHFVDSIKAMSIEAVDADIANIRTKLLTADVITADHLNVNNTMIDTLFATSALITRLTTKTAFINQLRSNIIDASTIRVGFNNISSNVTINSSGITIDGGALTVNRDDGGAPTIIKGHNPSGVYLYPSTPNRRDSGFTLNGQYARRERGSNFLIYDFYMFEWFYTDLIFDFAIYNHENHDIRVRIEILGTDGSTFSRAVDYTIPHTPVRVAFPRLILKLGVPDGSLQRFFIRTRNVGTSSQHGRYGLHTYMVKHLDNGHGFPRLEDNGLQ